MVEGGNYSPSEECSRCMNKARSSEGDADLWAWVFLSKGWLDLIHARRGYDAEAMTLSRRHLTDVAQDNRRAPE